MLIIKYDCLLGNNLFQYAFSRIIAEELGFEMDYEIAHPDLAWNGHPSRLDTLQEHFPNAPLRLPGKRYDGPLDIVYKVHTVDIKSITENKTPRKIFIEGFFQRMEYFEPHKKKIKEWFKFKKTEKVPYGKNDVVLVIRRGWDFIPWMVPLRYYDQALASMNNIGRVYITGTEVDEEVESYFSKYNPIYFNGPPIRSFEFIQHFNRIVMANSTFAWWAAFLSDAEEIISPRSMHPEMYAHTGFKDVDLHMRESRFKEFIITP